MDEFLIEAVSLKGLQKVRVGHDSSGPGAGWFLDKVVIKDPEDNTKEHVFPCNRFGIINHSLYAYAEEVCFFSRPFWKSRKVIVKDEVNWFSKLDAAHYGILGWSLETAEN